MVLMLGCNIIIVPIRKTINKKAKRVWLNSFFLGELKDSFMPLIFSVLLASQVAKYKIKVNFKNSAG